MGLLFKRHLQKPIGECFLYSFGGFCKPWGIRDSVMGLLTPCWYQSGAVFEHLTCNVAPRRSPLNLILPPPFPTTSFVRVVISLIHAGRGNRNWDEWDLRCKSMVKIHDTFLSYSSQILQMQLWSLLSSDKSFTFFSHTLLISNPNTSSK